jgi:hypothetical protein
MPDNGWHVVKHKMIRKALNKITSKVKHKETKRKGTK